jgi:hypothetical protein
VAAAFADIMQTASQHQRTNAHKPAISNDWPHDRKSQERVFARVSNHNLRKDRTVSAGAQARVREAYGTRLCVSAARRALPTGRTQKRIPDSLWPGQDHPFRADHPEFAPDRGRQEKMKVAAAAPTPHTQTRPKLSGHPIFFPAQNFPAQTPDARCTIVTVRCDRTRLNAGSRHE